MRVTVTLRSDEKVALRQLAEWERRDPRDQAALLIRRGLEGRGLLPVNRTTETQERERRG